MKPGRRLAMAALAVTMACANPQPDHRAQEAPSDGQPPWGSVLGGSGGSAAERVVAGATPPCLVFGDRASLQRKATALRADFARQLGIDLKRRAKSAVVQRTLRSAGHEVEVVRLEVLDGVYLPLNIYVPRRHERGTPIVMSPVGCSSSCGSPGPQALAANLAEMGIVVVVSEGFCDNGARATLPDGDSRIGYARELLGLRSPTAVHVQELVSALTWVIERFPFVNADAVGVAGYSYGGAMSLLLAQVDRRVRSVSVPATSLGAPCDARSLPVSDIYLQDEVEPGFVWSAPLEVPFPPRNARMVMLYPRFLHTTAGARDRAAPPEVIEGAMRDANDIWGLAGLGDRLLFKADDGDHNYGRGRREDTYEWFARTLLCRPATRPVERDLPQRSTEELAVDITGTRTLTEQLRAVARVERARRFPAGQPTLAAASHARRAARQIFGERAAALAPDVVWRGNVAGLLARALRYRGEAVDLPALEIEGSGRRGSGMLLFLPERGVAEELDAIRERAQRFERVVAVDYLGIGELASDRVMLHTFAWSLMHAEESVPVLNLALLRGLLQRLEAEFVDVEGVGWAASVYAGALAALEPARVRRLHLSGMPDDELGRLLEATKKVPDLLLHPSLFRHLTAAELARSARLR